jgi:hypothetical protein
MQVKAIAEGFDNIAVRKVDEVFDMPDGSTAPWFVAVDAEPAVNAKAASKAEAKAKAEAEAKAQKAGSDVA